jgi:multiple antibiotic resistance protein
METFFVDNFTSGVFWTLVFAKALPLFMTLDPLGNTAIIGALIQNFEVKQQHRILRREMLIAFVVMLFFYWAGTFVLNALDISQAAVEITGGLVFLMFAVGLLFANHADIKTTKNLQEPFIVPIAIPLIAGPSCLATIMLYSHESVNPAVILPALFLAWIAATFIILMTPFLTKTIGKIGLRILEQIMGLLCIMIAIKMFLRGTTTFLNT